MLQKIVSIKNVGRFRQSAGQSIPALHRSVFVLGANGFGKTTLCAILRSVQTGEPKHIVGRKTLGVVDNIEIHLLTTFGSVRFGPSGWTSSLPQIRIFDSVFVAENIHAGDVIDLEQKRNLYRIIIGQDGVSLAFEDSRLADESRAKTMQITSLSKSLEVHFPAGMKLKEFLKLPVDIEIDSKIGDQGKAIDAIRQAEQLRIKSGLTEIDFPVLPENLASVLAKSVDDVTADAELRVAQHLSIH